jgi:glycerophosphoryl diester phosphodiesterase
MSGRGTSVSSNDQIEILGHRGAKGVAPENTLASFQVALDVGVDMIELDVHLSKDGELVVIHDPDLERTTDGSTLQEVYDLVQGVTLINIEIKTAQDGSRYPGIERKVVEFVRQNEAIAFTIISSFDFPTLQDVQRLEPELVCYAIISKDYFREMEIKGNCGSDIVTDLKRNGFCQVAVNKHYLDSDLMSLLDQAGFKVCAWVVNDVDEMWKYADLGVDRITTDRPDLLLSAYLGINKENRP